MFSSCFFFFEDHQSQCVQFAFGVRLKHNLIIFSFWLHSTELLFILLLLFILGIKINRANNRSSLVCLCVFCIQYSLNTEHKWVSFLFKYFISFFRYSTIIYKRWLILWIRNMCIRLTCQLHLRPKLFPPTRTESTNSIIIQFLCQSYSPFTIISFIIIVKKKLIVDRVMTKNMFLPRN